MNEIFFFYQASKQWENFSNGLRIFSPGRFRQCALSLPVVSGYQFFEWQVIRPMINCCKLLPFIVIFFSLNPVVHRKILWAHANCFRQEPFWSLQKRTKYPRVSKPNRIPSFSMQCTVCISVKGEVFYFVVLSVVTMCLLVNVVLFKAWFQLFSTPVYYVTMWRFRDWKFSTCLC